MTATRFDRRLFLRGAAIGAGTLAAGSALSFADFAAAATAEAQQSAFGYGVASGDPTASAVIIWTRVNPSPDATPGSGIGDPTKLRWEVASDAAFADVVSSGQVTATRASDFTVKIDVTGLATYTRYFYRFTVLDGPHAGTSSPTGRTQTAPDEAGVTHALRFAVVSCANYTGGYFSPYRHLAAREDLDFVLFLGDYIYEYGNGKDRYGPSELAGKRDHEPPIEPVGLRQYRIRHALYKADPDLQECHRRQAWIPIFDDHEVCDNTYDGGAANHEPDGDPDYGDGTRQEGDFYLRRRRAYQAYLEWMPIRLPGQTGAVGEYRFWRRFTYGDLADLSVLETRQNRSMQVSASDAQALMSPDRHLPEPQQLDWLTANIARVDQQWHLLGNQVVIAPVRVPALPAGFQVPPGFGTFTQGAVFNTDQWDGYQVDQAAVFTAMKNAPNDTVVFTGDIHSSWANDLPDAGYTDAVRQGFSVGTEFVCPSVTSDGFYEIFARNRQAATGATTAFMGANRHVRMLDGIYHGFAVADVTPERVHVDWWWITSEQNPNDPRLDPNATIFRGASWETQTGSRIVNRVDAAAGPRRDQPAGATNEQPNAAVPEVPTAILAPVGAAALLGGGLVALRRRGSASVT